MDLEGKAALITGGGTGLGKQVALTLAREGMNVAIVYSRSEKEAAETVGELNALGSRSIAIRGDVSNSSDVKAIVDRMMQEYGRIDVLMNNAGATVFKAFEDLEGVSESDWDHIMAVNVKGPWLMTKAVAPIMKKQGAGRIIQTTSVSGLRAGGSSLPYTVSKAAETQLTRGLAMALAPEITVNAIAPGLLDTRWGRLWGDEELKRKAVRVPLKHLPAVEDCAAAVLMMIKNDSMTGQSIVVDSGDHFH
jgi:3-oxoacyl-[acyl-carrier protein] reductase